MNSISEFFKGIGELYTQEIEMAAIWLSKPVQTATERTVRITEGHLIKVESGQIVDCTDGKPTHKVIGCYGTVSSSSLSLVLIDLETQSPATFKLK